MANILPENETVTFEDQTYVNPETSLNEQNTFIDNLRASQARQNAEIQQQTHDLGTNVPSNLGGLVGGEGYFTSRYQTPQTNALISDLRANAQAQALSQVLENQLAMMKQSYNKAYDNYRRRAAAASGGGGATTTTGGTGDYVNDNPTDYVAKDKITADSKDLAAGGYYVAGNSPGYMDWTSSDGSHHKTFDKDGNVVKEWYTSPWPKKEKAPAPAAPSTPLVPNTGLPGGALEAPNWRGN